MRDLREEELVEIRRVMVISFRVYLFLVLCFFGVLIFVNFIM